MTTINGNLNVTNALFQPTWRLDLIGSFLNFTLPAFLSCSCLFVLPGHFWLLIRERPSGLTSVITDIVAAVVTAVVHRRSEVQLRLSAFVRNVSFIRRSHCGREISS